MVAQVDEVDAGHLVPSGQLDHDTARRRRGIGEPHPVGRIGGHPAVRPDADQPLPGLEPDAAVEHAVARQQMDGVTGGGRRLGVRQRAEGPAAAAVAGRARVGGDVVGRASDRIGRLAVRTGRAREKHARHERAAQRRGEERPRHGCASIGGPTPGRDCRAGADPPTRGPPGFRVGAATVCSWPDSEAFSRVAVEPRGPNGARVAPESVPGASVPGTDHRGSPARTARSRAKWATAPSRASRRAPVRRRRTGRVAWLAKGSEVHCRGQSCTRSVGRCRIETRRSGLAS